MKRAPPGNERLAVAYLRVSTEDQRLGPEAQKHDCELWARQQGVGIVETLIDQGVSGGTDLENHQLVRTVLDGAAAYERAVIKGRTKAALAAKVRRGERIGQIPYGFRLKEQGPRNDRGFPILLEPDPQEQALLGRIKGCQGLSLRKLRALLTAEGYRNRRGKAIAVTQLHRLRHRLAREGAHAPGGAG